MLDIQVSEDLHTLRQKYDIATWEDVDVSNLSNKAKKRFHRRQTAIHKFFTSDSAPEVLAHEAGFASLASFQSLLEQCLMQHEDGKPWGYRALLPDVHVVDHTPRALAEDTPNQVEETSTDAEHAPVEPLAEDIPIHREQVEPVILETSTTDEPETDGDANSDEAGNENTITAKRPAIPPTPKLSVEVDEVPLAPVVPELSRDAQPSISAETDFSYSTEQPIPSALDEPSLSHLTRSTRTRPSALVLRLPKFALSHGQRSITKVAQQRRIVQKRRVRTTQVHSNQQHRFRWVSILVLAVILIMTFLPLGAGVVAYGVYTNVRGLALDGVNNLLTVKSLIPISKSNPLAALEPAKLQAAQSDFRKAESDFLQLQALVERPDIQVLVDQVSPTYGRELTMARHLVQVALDVSRMGDEMSGIAMLGAGILHGSPLASGSTKPLITPADVQAIDGAMIHALYYIQDIRTQMSQVDLKQLPISAKQQAEIASLMPLLPKAQDAIQQAQGLIGLVSWLLGVGQTRRYLIQTMDRAELRPSGGFTGQYGIVQITDGRMAPLSLRDVALLDYAGNGVELGRQAPPQYSNWMNFGNWGLRDSNLSGDYPTTAQMSMQVFQDEGGGPVDGDISFTPTFIAHILDVTGPIYVAEYNETITSKNLEDRLHYYQQNYSAIAIEQQKTGSTSHSVRKAFTSLVGSLLLDRIRHLSTSQLIEIVKGAIKDIQSRDLEIYFTNPAAESWLVQHDYSGAMSTFTANDGFMVVQANISISKASQYVHTTEQDNVVLDAQGGATHNLTITLNYQQTGPVYGFDTYADYIRVYVPQNAQFLSGDGFDTGVCLTTPGNNGGSGSSASSSNCCTDAQVNPPANSPPTGAKSSTPPSNSCTQYRTSFPSAARYCPDGLYSLGDRGYKQPWRYDSLGAPTALTSDLPGRAMFGGLTVTPKNCISYITLSWYVPHAVQQKAGQPTYALLVGKQGGYTPTVEISVDTSAAPIKGAHPFQFNGDLVADKVFTISG